jgi:hypothetical protein
LKSKSENVGSPVDEGKMEPMKEYDSVKGGETIRTDWRLLLLKCIRDPKKTTDKKVKQQVLNSSPYYAQANGQAEASNKVLIKIIKKRIKDNLRRWHEKLSEALWAQRTSRHGARKVTPFELVYG